MAEWLRRLTRNQFPSGSAGSNPADCEELFPFPHLWHSNCDKPLFIFHNCGIQAAPLTFIKHLTFKPAHTLWTITVCLSWSIVGSVVECSPATRAARVRFPDDAIFFFPFSQRERVCARKLLQHQLPLFSCVVTTQEKVTLIEKAPPIAFVLSAPPILLCCNYTRESHTVWESSSYSICLISSLYTIVLELHKRKSHWLKNENLWCVDKKSKLDYPIPR